MAQIKNEINSTRDRILLPFSFDVTKMKAEIKLLKLNDYIYYDVLPLRSPAHMVDSSRPLPPPADDYADGSWTDWLDTPSLKKSSYLLSVVDTFRNLSNVTLVRLLRLAPDAKVDEHTDPTLGLHIPKSVIRLTIPIQSDNSVEFFLNNKIVPMKPGECWYLRLTDPHRINNAGIKERINMTIDIVPNEKIRTLLNES